MRAGIGNDGVEAETTVMVILCTYFTMIPLSAEIYGGKLPLAIFGVRSRSERIQKILVGADRRN